MSLLRPCLVCGTPVPTGSRCAQHPAPPPAQPRPSAARQGWDYAWRKLSREARARQPWCSWCGADTDLTADHLRWPATTLDDVQVLCRSCNSRKGALRRRITPKGGEEPPASRRERAAAEAKSATLSRSERAWWPR